MTSSPSHLDSLSDQVYARFACSQQLIHASSYNMHSSKYRGDKGGLTKDLFDAANQGKIDKLKLGLQRSPGLLNEMRMR